AAAASGRPVKVPVVAGGQTVLRRSAVVAIEKNEGRECSIGRDAENTAFKVGSSGGSRAVEIAGRIHGELALGTVAVGALKRSERRQRSIGREAEDCPEEAAAATGGGAIKVAVLPEG